MTPIIEFWIYDGRYHEDPDRAIVNECCDSLEEARAHKNDYGADSVIVKVSIRDNQVVAAEVIEDHDT